MPPRLGSVDPLRFPREIFDLYSIPAYDLGIPTTLSGNEIGSSKQLVQRGDVLFSRIVPHIRRAWIVGETKGHRTIGSGEWIVLRSPELLPDYLRHFLLTDDCNRQVMRTLAGVGGSLMRARPAGVAQILIPVPPLEEQKRIAAILDKADAIRRKREQAIQLADEFLRSLFLEMFGDPVSNPKGWPVKALSSLSRFENGDRSSNYPSGDDVVKEGVLFLNSTNITNNLLDLSATRFITAMKFASLTQGKARDGDVLITLRGTLGKCCIFRDVGHKDAFINAQMMIIRAEQQILPEYLHAVLASRPFQGLFGRLGHGGAVPQLTGNQIGRLTIPCPPLAAQHKFLNKIDLLWGLRERGLHALKFAKQLFNAVQQSFFKG